MKTPEQLAESLLGESKVMDYSAFKHYFGKAYGELKVASRYLPEVGREIQGALADLTALNQRVEPDEKGNVEADDEHASMDKILAEVEQLYKHLQDAHEAATYIRRLVEHHEKFQP